MILNTILSWLGLTRTSYYHTSCMRVQIKTHECFLYRDYLRELKKDTPHKHVKESVNAILNSAPKDSVSFVAGCYSDDS